MFNCMMLQKYCFFVIFVAIIIILDQLIIVLLDLIALLCLLRKNQWDGGMVLGACDLCRVNVQLNKWRS